jgi:hypothetical protein
MKVNLEKERKASLRRQAAKIKEKERIWQSEPHMTLHRSFRNFTTDRFRIEEDYVPPNTLTPDHRPI